MSNTSGKMSCIATALALIIAAPAFAQNNNPSADSVPVPSQLTSARTAFIANAGGPLNYLNQEAYIDFYRALAASKRFQFTAKPADAELSLELSVTSHQDGITYGTSQNAPFLQL